MICIECSNPNIKCLYSDFKKKFIQLTICQKCGNVADKYIEYDKVILFLDVLLLKPQAYRHAAYNLVEEEIFRDVKIEVNCSGSNGQDLGSAISHSNSENPDANSDPNNQNPDANSDPNNQNPDVNSDPNNQNPGNARRASIQPRYNKLRRYFVLSVLFEVYLEWAYEEKNPWNTPLIAHVLRAPPLWQYCFFILQQCIRKLTFYFFMVFLFTHILGWGTVVNKNLLPGWSRSYYRCVLISTILMSLAVKSLPIIMLIWPYENASLANTVVSILGMFNTIEALQVITNHSYGSICAVVIASAVISLLAQHVAMCFLVGHLCLSLSPLALLSEECKMAVMRVLRVFELFSARV